MTTKQHSIGKEKAIALAKSEWWKDKPASEIARFQLFTQELAMPFSVFHEALEKSLGRPVFTHELGLDFDGIVQEFLRNRPAPSMEDILALVPQEKLIVVTV